MIGQILSYDGSFIDWFLIIFAKSRIKVLNVLTYEDICSLHKIHWSVIVMRLPKPQWTWEMGGNASTDYLPNINLIKVVKLTWQIHWPEYNLHRFLEQWAHYNIVSGSSWIKYAENIKHRTLKIKSFCCFQKHALDWIKLQKFTLVN